MHKGHHKWLKFLIAFILVVTIVKFKYYNDPYEGLYKYQCIKITQFHFNAKGNDNYNLNDEYITLKNICNEGVNLTNWTVKSKSSKQIYTFPTFVLKPNSNVTLFSGKGNNTLTKLYWNKEKGDYASIWGNKKDTLYLRDTKGDLILVKYYNVEKS